MDFTHFLWLLVWSFFFVAYLMVFFNIIGDLFRDGELDIVAMDGDDVVVVEVKTRSGTGFGHPAEAVTRAKVARLRRLAAEWLSAHDLHAAGVRIDVVAVVRRRSGAAQVEHLRGVV